MRSHRNIFFISLVSLAAGCTQHEGRAMTNDLKAGLDSSNSIMMKVIELNYQSFADKCGDPFTHKVAVAWEPRVYALSQISLSCTRYIDSLSAGKIQGSAILAARLSAYESAVKAFDMKNSPSVYYLPDNFDKISDTLSRQAILSRVKNSLLIAEYNSLNYCLNTVVFVGCIYYGPAAMINNNRFRKGDTIQIMAWIGAVQDRMDLTLSVNGTSLPQKNWEPITYRFAANKQPGHHDLPITLQYRKRDGTIGIASKTFTYDIIP